jgi:hypothetical protein
MRTLLDEFIHADIEMSSYVRSTKEMAKIEVLYFPDRDEVVKKILRSNLQKEKCFYDKGLDED